MQEMISQKVRTLSPEIDPLRMGMGQTEADLEKPQVMVESTLATAIPAARTCCVWWKPPLREYAARAGTCALLCYRYMRRHGAGTRRHQLLARFEGDHCGCHRDPRYGHAF